MAGHAQLKFVMTECWKTQIRLTGLRLSTPVLKELNHWLGRNDRTLCIASFICYFTTTCYNILDHRHWSDMSQVARRLSLLFSGLQLIISGFPHDCFYYMSHGTTKPTKWPLRPAKIQINLGICPFWSESSLSARRSLGSLATHKAQNEYWSDWVESDWVMPMLISVFVGCTCHFFGFVVLRLKVFSFILPQTKVI